MFINGFLGLLTAAGQGTATEFAGSGYARQPITFGKPVKGVCFNATPWNFGTPAPGVLGRAVWDAPTGGNLLLVLPFVATTNRMARDFGDVGALRLVISDMVPYPDGDAYVSEYAAGALLGTVNELADVQGGYGAMTTSGATGTVGGGLVSSQPGPVIATAPLSTGGGVTIARGILQALDTGIA